jgi:hypothetical protein
MSRNETGYRDEGGSDPVQFASAPRAADHLILEHDDGDLDTVTIGTLRWVRLTLNTSPGFNLCLYYVM